MLCTAGILETSGVAFTTFQFTGAAFTWCEAYERRRPVGAVPLTWQEFSTLFLKKYVPQSRREELRRQFEWLKQGDMTVSQYEARYYELDRHTGWMVSTDHERIRRFVDGLNYHLRILMTRERGQPSLSALSIQSSSRASLVKGYSVASPSTGPSSARGSLQSLPPAPGSCYECGKFRHMRRQCPRLHDVQYQQRGQPSTSAPVISPPVQPARGRGQEVKGRPRGRGRSGGSQARFYAIPGRTAAIASDTVITGIVSVCHRDAAVLFDPGSTYSYVSSYFARYLGTPQDSLSLPVHVSTPVGDTVIVDRVYLSSVMRMVGKGCLSYLDFVRDVGVEAPSIDSVPVARDFTDVFPADLSGMPLARDIDFGIDLVLGTQPISIAPYRMALAELKELKEQL
ncbi:uncharacterized protein [Nicotiana sylvestris]|uniref:uncharacterized protein n=1 Tax=Nicotiana sylvestris TaxID=4096 RepID=UPI00388C862E